MEADVRTWKEKENLPSLFVLGYFVHESCMSQAHLVHVSNNMLNVWVHVSLVLWRPEHSMDDTHC
ncbi:hypothetical protein CsSME_00037760 [Camellia sinensis var. sinensis]